MGVKTHLAGASSPFRKWGVSPTPRFKLDLLHFANGVSLLLQDKARAFSISQMGCAPVLSVGQAGVEDGSVILIGGVEKAKSKLICITRRG